MTHQRTRNRRSIRLKGYDYTQPGAYFVTICTYRRIHLFGEVVDGEMRPNVFGEIVRACWDEIPKHFPRVELDAFVVMPNHVHGIIAITSVGATHASPLPTLPLPTPPPQERPRGPTPQSLGAIVGSFKSAVTRRINALRNTPGAPVWQRNYWEHVIRNEHALNAVRRYIIHNPARWHLDRYNPDATAPDPWALRAWRLMQSTSAESEVRS